LTDVGFEVPSIEPTTGKDWFSYGVDSCGTRDAGLSNWRTQRRPAARVRSQPRWRWRGGAARCPDDDV